MRLCILSIISGVFLMGSLVAQEITQSKQKMGAREFYITCGETKTGEVTRKRCAPVPSGTESAPPTTYETRKDCLAALKDYVCSQ